MAHKSHKIALRVASEQNVWFHSQCGYARFACNSALSDFKAGLDSDIFHSGIDLNNRFNERKKEYEWAKAQDQRAALYAIRNLTEGIKRWKDKISGFPKFKKRGHRLSYTTDEQAVKVEGKRIKLPKIGWVRMFQELRFEGEIIRVTISKTAHRWFVSITVDTGTPNVRRDTRGLPVIGIDVGINSLATLDNGKHYDNPRPLKRYERKLAKALSDSALGGFLSKLKTKAEVLGIPVIEAPRFFASSKTCSSCGYVKDELSLSERVFHCEFCYKSIDRDKNAAINVKKLAVGYTES